MAINVNEYFEGQSDGPDETGRDVDLVKNITDLLKKQEEASSEIAEIRGSLKSEHDHAKGRGVNLKAFKIIKPIMAVKNDQDRMALIDEVKHYLELLHSPQQDMFGHNSGDLAA